MTRRTQKSLCLPALAAALAIALAALVLGTWASDDQRHGDRAGQYAPTAERQQAVAADPKRGPRAGPPVDMELGADTQLDRSAQLELVVAARRFATTLAQWLYGDRREI